MPSPKEWFEQAINARRDGDVERALMILDRLIALDPSAVAVRYQRARALLAEGRHDEAESDLDLVLEIEPESLAARLRRAEARMRQGRAAEAAGDLNVLAQQERPHAEVFVLRGEAFLALDQAHRALADYNRALELDPSRQAALVGRAQVQIRLARTEIAAPEQTTDPRHERLQAALTDIEKAHRLQASPLVTEIRAQLYEQLELLEAADQDYAQLIERSDVGDPRRAAYVQARERLARAFFARKAQRLPSLGVEITPHSTLKTGRLSYQPIDESVKGERYFEDMADVLVMSGFERVGDFTLRVEGEAEAEGQSRARLFVSADGRIVATASISAQGGGGIGGLLQRFSGRGEGERSLLLETELGDGRVIATANHPGAQRLLYASGTELGVLPAAIRLADMLAEHERRIGREIRARAGLAIVHGNSRFSRDR